MNDKERLESIKKKFSAQRSVNARTYESLDLYDLSYEEGDWLIEQAEKVEQLQQEIASLKEALNESVKTSVALDNELQQEQVKIERCKEIFKDIREASSDIYALRKAEQALKALEGKE